MSFSFFICFQHCMFVVWLRLCSSVKMSPNFLGANIIWVFIKSKMNIIWFVQHILLSTKTWISLCHHHFKHILCYILDSSWCTTEEHKPHPALLWNQAKCSLHLSKDIKIIWTNAVFCAQLELKINHHGNGSASINGLINTKRLPWGQQTVHCASCGTLHHTRLHPPSHTSSTHWNRLPQASLKMFTWKSWSKSLDLRHTFALKHNNTAKACIHVHRYPHKNTTHIHIHVHTHTHTQKIIYQSTD